MAAAETSEVPANAVDHSWISPGVQAVLCNLGKFPQFNGKVVTVAGWNAEKKRWKCLFAAGGDVNVPAANLQPLVMPEEKVMAIEAALNDGRVFDAWQALLGHPAPPPKLTKVLADKLDQDAYRAEILDGRLAFVEIAGKGNGYKAMKPIQKGDVLLTDHALTCQKKLLVPDTLNLEALCDTLRRVKEGKVGPEDLPFRVPTEGFGQDRLGKTLENYTLECSRDPGHIAVFRSAALFNHSCCPNAYADSSRTQCVVRALSDISEGEEVCISYVPVSCSVQERRRKLSSYGFSCECARCVEEAKSDPQLRVPCKCGEVAFSQEENARMNQVCQKCGTTFEWSWSKHNLSRVVEANRRQQEAMVANPSREQYEFVYTQLKKLSDVVGLVKEGAAHGVAPLHSEAVLLLQNLGDLHHLLASRFKAGQKAQAMGKCQEFTKETLRRLEEKHPHESKHRDLGYFRALHLLTTTEGSCEEDAEAYSKKLADACRDCFGQPDLPTGFAL